MDEEELDLSEFDGCGPCGLSVIIGSLGELCCEETDCSQCEAWANEALNKPMAQWGPATKKLMARVEPLVVSEEGQATLAALKAILNHIMEQG